MQRLRLLALAGLAGALAIGPSSVDAQDAKKVSFGVMGGLSMPMGDLGDGYDSGFNITGSVHAPLSGKLRLRGDIGYESFAAKGIASIVDGTFNVLSFVGNVVLPLGQEASAGGIRPYVIGGAGLYRGSSEIELLGVSRSVSSTDLGINVGGGVEFKLSGFTTFAEARFVNVFSDGSSSWVPITFGVRF